MNFLKTALIATLALTATAMTSCTQEAENIKVTGITITSSPSPLNLTLGGSPGQVTATVAPSDATYKDVIWSAAPTGVVEVSSTGIVTPVAAGTATITATAESGVTKNITVSVTTPQSNVDGIYKGDFEAITPGSDTPFLLNDANVLLTVNEDMTAVDIKMLQVKFAEMMPIMDITIPGVTLTPKENGHYSISGEGIIPRSAMSGVDVPAERYIITGLVGDIAPTSKHLLFSTGCGSFSLNFSGKVD